VLDEEKQMTNDKIYSKNKIAQRDQFQLLISWTETYVVLIVT